MKKILSLLLVVLVVFCGSVTVFATEMNETDISQEQLFASSSICTSIAKNLNVEQINNFFDEEVSLDLQHLIPVYIPTGNASNSTLESMLESANTYNALVYSKSGVVLGTATLEYYENKWVVGTFYEGYNMLEKIGTIPMNMNQNFYYIENPYTNEQAILTVEQNTETYRSLTNSNGTVNASKIVDDINEVRQSNVALVDGTGTNANNNALTLYFISSAAIITLAVFASVFIWRKKARQ